MRLNPSTLARLALGAALPISALAAATQPTPIRAVAPELGSAFARETGSVRVIARVDERGSVTDATIGSSTNEALNPLALEAIRDWSFAPAMEDGRPVAAKVIQPFHFNSGSAPLEQAPADRAPRAKQKVAPKLEGQLARVSGAVALEASVDADGRVTDVRTRNATSEQLVEPAAAALRHWTFAPAIEAGRAVAAKVAVPFVFQGVASYAEIVAAASSVERESAPGAGAILADRAPAPTPRFSRELSRAVGSERGQATLLLTIDETGRVVASETTEASSDTIAAIASEAALGWTFKPAIKDGEPVRAKVSLPVSFNGGRVSTAAPANSDPVAKSTKTPELPRAIADLSGLVQVRLRVDERGNVVSASPIESTHAELVQPTLEAAQSWKFKPARRDGQTVSATVIVPFLFNSKS